MVMSKALFCPISQALICPYCKNVMVLVHENPPDYIYHYWCMKCNFKFDDKTKFQGSIKEGVTIRGKIDVDEKVIFT